MKQSKAMGNLGQLEVLLGAYFNDKGHYPPIKYQRAPGEPLHSWRILLLPYMHPEWGDRFEKYDFSKDWNSSENLGVMESEVPSYYQYHEQQDHFTDFVAVKMGDESESGSISTSCVKIIGDADIVLIEKVGSTIHWMSPED